MLITVRAYRVKIYTDIGSCHSSYYSQSRSRVNSNSKIEMNIRISLCNVRRVNEMLDISLEIVPKKTH